MRALLAPDIRLDRDRVPGHDLGHEDGFEQKEQAAEVQQFFVLALGEIERQGEVAIGEDADQLSLGQDEQMSHAALLQHAHRLLDRIFWRDHE